MHIILENIFNPVVLFVENTLDTMNLFERETMIDKERMKC